jgi:hypothetical protein
MELFRRAPLLTDCKFSNVGSDQQKYSLPDSEIIHATLNSLFLGPDDRPLISIFFSYLTLPSLIELVLGEGAGPLEFPADALVSFFARSSPPLKKLQLRSPIIDHEYKIVGVLEKIPALTHLNITPYYLTIYTPRHLFARLAESWLVGGDPGEHFLPKLESLHFSGHYRGPWDDVPKAFGPTSEISNPLRRPFIQLCFFWGNRDPSQNDYNFGHIDQENMMKFVALKDAGVDIAIYARVSGTNVDLIQKYTLEEL